MDNQPGKAPLCALLALILFNLVLGLLIGSHYGQTWDEPSFYIYGERSYEAYTLGLAGKPLTPERHIFFLDLRYYGPFYTALGWKLVNLLGPLMKGWGDMDIWHLINFFHFQIGLVSMYFLAKRFARSWTAFFVVLLFETQPLLFGHAFINPKDVPFSTFLLASVTAGLYMTDAMRTRQSRVGQPAADPFPSFSLILAALFGLYVFTYLGSDLIFSMISRFITAIYLAPAHSLLGRLFFALGGTAARLPVENYIHKAAAFHLERIILCLAALLTMGRRIYLDRKSGREWKLRFGVDARLVGLVLLAGIILGLATSVRLLAPFAGILVVVYAVTKKGGNAVPTLIVYGAIAAFVSLLTWPFLWDSPSFHFLEAVRVMQDFPYNAEVRFMGDNIAPSNLPWYYVTFLVCVQVTAPALVLSALGLGAVYYRRENIKDAFVLIAWFVVPLGLQVALRSNVYDNFRQFLFVLPPLFVLAGVGLERAMVRVKPPAMKIALTALCLLPGIVGVINLHPYQYIYYNTLVGGVSGAEGDFELDYWLTSYREAGEYINERASRDANILAWGSTYNGAREDLDVYGFGSEEDLQASSLAFEYAVISTRFFSHVGVLPDAPVVFEVRKGGALLAVVKELAR